jgi:hypothetical protein
VLVALASAVKAASDAGDMDRLGRALEELRGYRLMMAGPGVVDLQARTRKG